MTKYYLMKVLLLSIIVHLVFIRSNAQSGPEVCRLKYNYDVSGNRIKREYKCEATWVLGDPAQVPDFKIFTSVYPNPTSGGVTGIFSSPIGGEAGPAMVVVSTMGGITVFEQQYTQMTSSITFDISQQIPGQYLLTVAAFHTVETYIITKY